jgi:hypothetical protein
LFHPLKGKFRLFLLASFQNFLSDEASRARCQKRGRGREFVFLDSEDAKSRYRLEPADRLTAEKIFDARWAMTLLGHAGDRLRQEHAARGEEPRFEVLTRTKDLWPRSFASGSDFPASALACCGSFDACKKTGNSPACSRSTRSGANTVQSTG